MSGPVFRNLNDYLRALSGSGELVRIEAEVDPNLEIAEIHRRAIAAGGPALYFSRVRGSQFPVVTNLFGSAARMDLAFGSRPKQLVQRLARAPETLIPPSLGKLWRERGLFGQILRVGLRRRRKGPVTECRIDPPDLNALPVLKSWSGDGGPFITLPIVYSQDTETGQHNLGLYRIQRHGPTTAGVHWQIGKGGGFHYHKAERNGKSLPLTILVGGPPALILAAIAPLPENVPELLLASLVLGRRLDQVESKGHAHPMAAQAEFAIQGTVLPHERLPEGPFGDHYGYYSLRHDYPVLHVERIFHRKNAVYPATVVGKPRQEDFFIGDYLQELLSPLFPLVMPAVRDLWSYGETGYHSLSAAVLSERYERESMSSAFRILGEGQLSLSKFLLAVDRPIDLKDFKSVLEYVLSRVDWSRDLYVFSHLSMDTLDYCGPEVNKGSKGVLLGMGEPRRRLSGRFSGQLPRGVDSVEVFCPGCLVVQGRPFKEEIEQAQRLAGWKPFAEFPLLVLVDNSRQTTATEARFLWTVFTRFEPAGDIYAAATRVERHHISYQGPVCIDARIKPHYPEELFCDPDTAKRVEDRWKEYFPDGGVEMGDSDSAHLDF